MECNGRVWSHQCQFVCVVCGVVLWVVVRSGFQMKGRMMDTKQQKLLCKLTRIPRECERVTLK